MRSRLLPIASPADLAWVDAQVRLAVGDVAAAASRSRVALSSDDVRDLLYAEAFELLAPSWALKARAQAASVDRQYPALPSDKRLLDALLRRLRLLTAFFVAATRAVAAHETELGRGTHRFTALSGDSHNGGCRPLAIHAGDATKVLKFVDPRPAQLLNEVLTILSEATGIDVTPPPIAATSDNTSYVTPFLHNDPVAGAAGAREFMRRLGVLVFASYLLKMVDVHLENIIAYGDRPVIIDSECMFYDMDDWDRHQQFWSTGMVGPLINMTSVRGGGIMSLFEKNLHEGQLYYFRQIRPVQHLAHIERAPERVSATDHIDDLLAGFSTAYEAFLHHRRPVVRAVLAWTAADMRLRWLIRATRHYAVCREMIFQPSLHPGAAARQVRNRLSASDTFLHPANAPTLAAEWDDLMNYDIPYFWRTAGGRSLLHRRGTLDRRNARRSAIEVLRDGYFDLFCEADLKSSVDRFGVFLHIPVEASAPVDLPPLTEPERVPARQ